MRIHQYNLPVFPPPMSPSEHIQEPNPFMNNMEEISYWVTTKRAPCLLNYDNVIKRQNEQAHCSKETLKTTPSVEVPHPKNKKRKLKLLDDSISSEKQQNIFIEKSFNKDGKAPKAVRSESLGSNVDFKIKPAKPTKPKKLNVQKKNKEMPTKAIKVCTSTPKNTILRRSLRKTRQSNNNNSQLNDSFEMLNSSAIIAEEDKVQTKVDSNKKINPSGNDKNATNGKYEDSSDVSGFTANYIRSTKVQTSKTAPKVQNKTRNQAKLKKGANDNIIMCVNKSVNTGNLNNTVLNCSTDSSHNIVNLVTIQQETTNNVDKSTSMLKFVDVKTNPELVSEKKPSRQKNITYDTSFQSKSSNASRYPKRQRKISTVELEKDCFRVNIPVRTTKSRMSKVSNSDRKENSVSILSKTRSGRKIGLDVDAEISGCSRLNLNNPSDQVSSGVTLNVGSRKARNNNSRTRCLRNKGFKDCYDETKKDSVSEDSERKLPGESSCVQMRSTRSTRHGKNINVTGLLSEKDSLRDKSGFANCFSDSDSDNEPLKQRKFFC